MRMGLLAEVKVRRDRVLEQMHDQISGKNQERGGVGKPHGLGAHGEQRGGKHEPGA